MPEPRRFESSIGADPADREGRAEALLIEGLDAYFAGRYDDAIHLWTRVLFLDRSHARARAYIDRARTALAERQRRGEEMLATTHDLLAQGRTEPARQLLDEAIATGAEDERALVLRTKLERLERLDALARRAGRRTAGADGEHALAPALPGWRWPKRSNRIVIAVAAMAGAGLAVAAGLLLVGDLVGLPVRRDRLAVPATSSQWPVLSSAEVALVRARTLYNGGRLAEALKVLDRITPDNPARAQADTLRVEIQEMLLAGGPDRFRPKVDRR